MWQAISGRPYRNRASAVFIFSKPSSLVSAAHLSGCHLAAALRYPRRICCADASAATPTQGLSDVARHVIQRVLNPCFLSQMTSYDVASTIQESLVDG